MRRSSRELTEPGRRRLQWANRVLGGNPTMPARVSFSRRLCNLVSPSTVQIGLVCGRPDYPGNAYGASSTRRSMSKGRESELQSHTPNLACFVVSTHVLCHALPTHQTVVKDRYDITPNETRQTLPTSNGSKCSDYGDTARHRDAVPHPQKQGPRGPLCCVHTYKSRRQSSCPGG
jgi:hypothetical protein